MRFVIALLKWVHVRCSIGSNPDSTCRRWMKMKLTGLSTLDGRLRGWPTLADGYSLE